MGIRELRRNVEEARYRRLWRWVVLITGVLAISPLVALTVVNYIQYQNAIEAETRDRVLHLLAIEKRSLESFLAERRAALTLLTLEHSREDLAEPGRLDQVFGHLQEVTGGIVDLGLIDAEGVQAAYAGPLEDMEGKDYSSHRWWRELKSGQGHVSEVFLGYRNSPHFVIAVTGAEPGGGFFALRATVSAAVLEEQLEALPLEAPAEAFIVNREGALQTGTRNFGPALEPLGRGLVLPVLGGEGPLEEAEVGGARRLVGKAPIGESPFILVIVKDLEGGGWAGYRRSIWLFLLASAVLVMLMIMGSSYYLVSRVREADTQRARMLNKFEYTNRLASVGRLAAGVAHEINNPLAIINERAGMIQDIAEFGDDFPDREKVAKYSESIQGSVERCSRITRRLLGFARQLEVVIETIDMKDLMREVQSFLEHEAEYRRVKVEIEEKGEAGPVESDRGQLQQVFLNIMNNALKAISDHQETGVIRVRIEPAARGGVTVRISDDGPGISEDNLRHIFDPFFTTKADGTGLGLSITYGIVNRLGGKISVDSELGKGTTFKVSLPRRIEPSRGE